MKIAQINQANLNPVNSNISHDDKVTKLLSNLNTIKESKKEILKEFLKSDQYGNSLLSEAIEKNQIGQIKELYPIKKANLTAPELLLHIADDINHKTFREEYEITDSVAKRIYSEINDKLHLMGEDTTDLVDNCTLFE